MNALINFILYLLQMKIMAIGLPIDPTLRT